jgi:hypothetical protein
MWNWKWLRFVVALVMAGVWMGGTTLTHAQEPARSQEQVAELLSLSIEEAGFGGFYRPDRWVPLKLTVTNRGDTFNGRVIVRPETSGTGLNDTYSAQIIDLARPIAPATETTETLFLYLIAESGDIDLRVELLNADGGVVTSEDVILRDILPRDGLHITVPGNANVDLSRVRAAGYSAAQVGWGLDDLPDDGGALEAVDTILFSDVDTSQLREGQFNALREWLIAGGHLIIVGSDPLTAAGLGPLAPLQPTGTTTADDFAALLDFAGVPADDMLDGETDILTGDVREGAQALVQTAAGLPLIVRDQLGDGTVDVVTFSPDLQPLRSWDGLDQVWFTLASSRGATPSWSLGWRDWSSAQNAVEILPGIDLLPAALSLVAFLGLYILLIGPLNYFVLSRINRQGYAWITIPILIGVFSVLAYTVGFELRGNAVTLSRLSVVQVWPEAETAQVNQLIGLLAPRRGNYTLHVDEARMLRPIGEDPTAFGSLERRTTNIEIRQYTDFSAEDFPVDASFIAAFSASGVIDSPAISGRVTVSTAEDGDLNLRGFVRNDSAIILQEPTLLVRGTRYVLGETLGDELLDFDVDGLAPRPNNATPAVLERPRSSARVSAISLTSGSARTDPALNVREIIGPDAYFNRNRADDETEDGEQELNRRRELLEAFIVDDYAADGRGNRAYLIGWADLAPFSEAVPGEQINRVDTTLYIVALELENSTVLGADRVITPDQFTWIALERDGVADIGPVEMERFDENQLAFRFTPVPGAVLDEVEELIMITDRGTNARTSGAVDLWDWAAGTWETVTFDTATRHSIADFERFLGPQNAIEVRTVPRSEGGTSFLSRIAFEQHG